MGSTVPPLPDCDRGSGASRPGASGQPRGRDAGTPAGAVSTHRAMTPESMAGAIEAGLKTDRFGRPWSVYERVGSTNDEAAPLARQGAPEGTTVIAQVQTRGRGRRGRTWHSPAGGLWLSVGLRPRLARAQSPLLGLAASAGAAD